MYKKREIYIQLLAFLFITCFCKLQAQNPFVEQTRVDISDFRDTGAAWADYNNDGYLDLVVAGMT